MPVTTSLPQLKRIGLTATLRHCPLFGALTADDLDRVADFTILKGFEKGEYVFREGDPAHGFFVVQSGAINLHRVSNTGKEQIIRIFRAGESFGEATVAGSSGYPADARAIESSQLLLVQKNGFLDLLKANPQLALTILAHASQQVHALITQIDDLMLKDVESRLATWLLQHCPDPQADRPCTVELNMSKRVLAAELGTISETFSRTLAKFRRQQMLHVDGRAITIHSPSRLQTFLKNHVPH